MSKRIKVLQVILELGPGGVEKFLVDFMLNYNKDKFDISVVSLLPKENSIFEKILEDNNVDVTYLNMVPWIYDIRVLKKLNRIIKDKQPDIIHMHLFMTRFVLLPAIFNKVPVNIHTVHIPADKEAKGIFKLVQSIAYKKKKIIPVAISNSVEQSIRNNHGFKDSKVIYNGIDLTKFNVKSQIEKNKTEINLINVARFMPEKDHDLLIDAFKIVVEKYPKVKLRLIGSGRNQDKVFNKIKNLNLEKNIELLGSRMDIPELLNKSDIFLLSSKYEGFGLVIVEAMACGLPVVSTSVGGIPEIIRNKENGVLVESRNAEDFAKAIIEVIENNNLRKKIIENAIHTVKKYDFKETIKKYEELYISSIRNSF